jgi:hypothetical protein
VHALCLVIHAALQVAHLNLPGSELFRKLRQLKSEKGGLTSQDERHFAQLRRSLEAEVLAHADVVRRVLTCVRVLVGTASGGIQVLPDAEASLQTHWHAVWLRCCVLEYCV